jgi:uncharacterized protein (DUF1697 family)
VLFSAAAKSERAIERAAEKAMKDRLGRTFLTFVRSLDALRELIDADPYLSFRFSAGSKRVVTFLRDAPASAPSLPIELDGARILTLRGREVFTAYLPSSRGPVFMTLIANTFGEDVTTRTWDTIKKIAGTAAEPRSGR